MSFLSAFVLKYLPFCTAFAAGSTTMGKIVGWAAGIGGGVVALFLIISLAKDGIGLAKGSGDSSILKIIGKALHQMTGCLHICQIFQRSRIERTF